MDVEYTQIASRKTDSTTYEELKSKYYMKNICINTRWDIIIFLLRCL